MDPIPKPTNNSGRLNLDEIKGVLIYAKIAPKVIDATQYQTGSSLLLPFFLNSLTFLEPMAMA